MGPSQLIPMATYEDGKNICASIIHFGVDPWKDNNHDEPPTVYLDSQSGRTFQQCQIWLSRDNAHHSYPGDMVRALVGKLSEPQLRQALWAWARDATWQDDYAMIYVTAPDTNQGGSKEGLLRMALSVVHQLIPWLPRNYPHYFRELYPESTDTASIKLVLELLEKFPPLDIGRRKLCCIVDRVTRFRNLEDDLDMFNTLLTLHSVFTMKNKGRLLFSDHEETRGFYAEAGCSVEIGPTGWLSDRSHDYHGIPPLYEESDWAPAPKKEDGGNGFEEDFICLVQKHLLDAISITNTELL
ncbi:hypothetical protein F5X99DRAFT_404594 [Biscogniauxia marginata]|nr:hypothetical protein F5X99DRAFT_404594 [Biscogniauxia marginata]